MSLALDFGVFNSGSMILALLASLNLVKLVTCFTHRNICFEFFNIRIIFCSL
jgi:hypothetical protein